MRFQVIENDGVFLLKDNVANIQAEVYAFGALLNKFTIKKDHQEVNVIDGFASVKEAEKNITQLHKSAKLLPFVCRLENAGFSFQEKEYSIHKFNMGSAAIHGLIFDATFTKEMLHEDDTKATLILKHHYHTEEHGFPFQFTVLVAYKLGLEGKLRITTTVTNHSHDPMPLCDGWHTYFSLGENIDQCQLAHTAQLEVGLNSALLPDGSLEEIAPMQPASSLAGISYDKVFKLNDFTVPSAELINQALGVKVSVYPDQSYPYLIIYTPEHRKSVAIESMSAAPNAFNNQMGLVVLAPEATQKFSTTYQISVL